MTIICIITAAILAIIVMMIVLDVMAPDEPDWHRSNLGKWEQYSGKQWGDDGE